MGSKKEHDETEGSKNHPSEHPEKRKPERGVPRPRGGRSIGDTFRSIAARLPYGKLTGAQTHNLASDLIGGILCAMFLLKSDNYILSITCVAMVLALSYLCLIATDRRRRF